MDELRGTGPCACASSAHRARRIVVTGGPGAGKTAVLELARRRLCRHAVVLPEAAGMLYRGGFPRAGGIREREATQIAIFHVQQQLESWAEAAFPDAALILCDRGTFDGGAYWPGEIERFWTNVGSNPWREFTRYAAVLHLRVPDRDHYETESNPLRIESVHEARDIDARIARVWKAHPHYEVVEASDEFLDKATIALERIATELPDCCRPVIGHNPHARSQ